MPSHPRTRQLLSKVIATWRSMHRNGDRRRRGCCSLSWCFLLLFRTGVYRAPTTRPGCRMLRHIWDSRHHRHVRRGRGARWFPMANNEISSEGGILMLTSRVHIRLLDHIWLSYTGDHQFRYRMLVETFSYEIVDAYC